MQMLVLSASLILQVYPNCPGLLGYWIERRVSLFCNCKYSLFKSHQPCCCPGSLFFTHICLISHIYLPLMSLEVSNALIYPDQKENKHTKTKQNKAMFFVVIVSLPFQSRTFVPQRF